ncbi:transcription initiation factor IIB family protein, partial [Candidatus Woesearchaeota archaeon]|nr:transcription initiation factor IIB family protein [Candidatus Woesearchaeota archaeon]
LGTTISGSYYSKIKILHNWVAMPYKERSLQKDFKTIHDICIKGRITKNIEDDTKILYKLVTDFKYLSGENKGKFLIWRGVKRIAISASCLFIACVRNNETRTVNEIASMYDISDTDLNVGYKKILKYAKERNIDIIIGKSRPEHFIDRYCDELRIKKIYATEAYRMAKNLSKLGIAYKHTPFSVAAACIYLMCELNELKLISRKKVAMVFNISDMTITKVYKEIEPYKYIVVDNNLTDIVCQKINAQTQSQEISSEIAERMKKFGINEQDTFSEKIDKINRIIKLMKNTKCDEQKMEYVYEIQELTLDIKEMIHNKINSMSNSN